jgi:hypothetical protein
VHAANPTTLAILRPLLGAARTSQAMQTGEPVVVRCNFYGGSKKPLRACTVNFLSFAFKSSL